MSTVDIGSTIICRSNIVLEVTVGTAVSLTPADTNTRKAIGSVAVWNVAIAS